MGAIIFRKREHLFERQRVVRTLKMMASMGPIARLWPGSIRTQHSSHSFAAKIKPRSLVAMLCRDDNLRALSGRQSEDSIGMTLEGLG